MFRKTFESRRPFSITLAIDLLEFEIQKLYGNEVKIVYSTAWSTPALKVDREKDSCSRTDFERKYFAGSEKYITIKAVVGPFGRLVPDAPAEDRRRHLRQVRAIVRLFNLETNVNLWQPHFLQATVKDSDGTWRNNLERYYEEGRVAVPSGEAMYISCEAKNADHPFAEIISSQHMMDTVRPEQGEAAPGERDSFLSPYLWVR
jgi:hypothetical protein